MLNILVIEDLDSDFRLTERQILREPLVARCLQARTSDEIEAALTSSAWDVVLVDYVIPGVHFEQMLTRIQQQLPFVPVILLSSRISEEMASELLRRGITDFILKDRLSRLGPAIRRSLDEARLRRQQAEATDALRTREAHFRAIFDGIGDAAVFADTQRRILMVNPAFTRVFGYGADEVIGRRADFLYLSFDDFLALGRRYYRTEAGQSPQAPAADYFEWRYRRHDGEPFWAEAHASPIFDDQQRLIGFLSLIRDISERKKTEDRLQQAAAVYSNSQEGIVITDARHRILNINPAFTTITGYTEADVLGRPVSLLQSGRHGPEFYADMRRDLVETGQWRGEIWNRRKTGEIYPEWLTINALRDNYDSVCSYVGVFTDISQLKASEARLERLAHFDPLTGLPNRLLAQSRLQHALDRSQRRQTRVAALYIDLDRFKTVNDSLGHPAGDELLCAVTQRLSKRLRHEDTLARLGGDEFLLLLEDLALPTDPTPVAQMLLNLFEDPFVIGGSHEVFVGASVGISVCPDDATSVTELIQHADAAMYLAKEQGRSTLRYYTEALSRQASERLALETRLRRALERREFLLHYQPQIDIGSGRLIGVEALVRWQPPGEAMVSPAAFIPVAEETGLIRPIGAWVMHEACRQMRAWLDAGWPEMRVAVNLSGRQFHTQDLVTQVQQVLQQTGLPAHLLELELTESVVMQHASEAIEQLRALKNLGVHLSVDDFGTGYSSLAYLKRFPIDKLKIDRSFVDGLPDDGDDREISSAIIAMARSLHLQVLAEGVETREQLDFLRLCQCDSYQGYHYSRPLPADKLEALLRQQDQLPSASR